MDTLYLRTFRHLLFQASATAPTAASFFRSFRACTVFNYLADQLLKLFLLQLDRGHTPYALYHLSQRAGRLLECINHPQCKLLHPLDRCSPRDGSTFLFRSTWHIRACTASIEIHGKSYHSIRSNVCQAAYIDFRTNLTQWLDVVLDESCWTVVLRSKSTMKI
eukprot:COSAG02_NODE_846_length_16565_cov_20.404627_3_plen_163_part_00